MAVVSETGLCTQSLLAVGYRVPGMFITRSACSAKALLNSFLLSTIGNLSKGEDTGTTGEGCMQFVRTALAPSSVH